MIPKAQLLATIPAGLRDPLFAEFDSILQNYLEGRWSPAELSVGRFCEIVYTVLAGYAKGSYGSSPSKPKNFVDACRALESTISGPRSFQILIPRFLPALYEIRNNRGVGHVGGDVDPNLMDATAAVAAVKWITAELIRVFHSVTTTTAQEVVDAIAEITVPIIWSEADVKRVLDVSLKQNEQILVLLASSPAGVEISKLKNWIEPSDQAYFLRNLRGLHKKRCVELTESKGVVKILPPGAQQISKILAAPVVGNVSAKRRSKKRR